jgi:pimeloyl-ACP methyl ester carboxylesterase
MSQSVQHPVDPLALAERYFEIGGARLRFKESGGGPAVVLVHGWALDLDVWELQARSLSAAYRVIRMDRRGYGLSRGRPSLSDDVTDIVALLRFLDVQRFALVGMSQGARIALKLCSLLPQRITAVILDGPPFIEAAPAGRPPEIPYDQYRAIALTKGAPAFRREWRKNPLTQLRSRDPQVRELLDKILDRYPGHDLTDATPPQAFPLDLQGIARRALPTLILSGEYDLETRQQSAQWLAEQLGGSIRQQIPNAGHLCGLDNPSVYNQVVNDFLSRHATGQ